ncbi:LamG-like jellyroll fold domain-containing protein [Candidatus Poribacteria bacterium]
MVSWLAILDRANVKLYLDGEEVAAVTLSTETPNTTGNVEIGGISYRDDYFKGVIDEAAVFNAVLTQKDIQAIMKRGLGNAIGGIAVESTGKLGMTWARIKSVY